MELIPPPVGGYVSGPLSVCFDLVCCSVPHAAQVSLKKEVLNLNKALPVPLKVKYK